MKWIEMVDNFPKNNFFTGLSILIKNVDTTDTMFIIKTQDMTYIASFDTVDKLPIDIEKDAIQISIWKNT